MAQGLDYLHTFDPPIIHLDIKSSNVLISESNRALITDFVITKHKRNHAQSDPSQTSPSPSDLCTTPTTNIGTMRWAAPERLRAARSSEEAPVCDFEVECVTPNYAHPACQYLSSCLLSVNSVEMLWWWWWWRCCGGGGGDGAAQSGVVLQRI